VGKVASGEGKEVGRRKGFEVVRGNPCERMRHRPAEVGTGEEKCGLVLRDLLGTPG
jgi:hypothetical protein